MNWKHQEMAKGMMSEWTLVDMKNIPAVVETFRHYLASYAPESLASLNDEAALDYFTKALWYRHFHPKW
jgi:hypothetical protein